MDFCRVCVCVCITNHISICLIANHFQHQVNLFMVCVVWIHSGGGWSKKHNSLSSNCFAKRRRREIGEIEWIYYVVYWETSQTPISTSDISYKKTSIRTKKIQRGEKHPSVHVPQSVLPPGCFRLGVYLLFEMLSHIVKYKEIYSLYQLNWHNISTEIRNASLRVLIPD